MEITVEVIRKNGKTYKLSFVYLARRIVILLLGMFYVLIAPIRLRFEKRRREMRKNSAEIGKFVLVLCPQGFNAVNLKQNDLNGSTKVNESLIELLQELKIDYKVVTTSKTFLASIYQLMKFSKNLEYLSNAEKVIVSIPGSSGFLASFLSKPCGKKVIFISHNPELFHRREWRNNVESKIRKFQYLIKSIVGFCADILVANSANHILALGEREPELYWKRIQFDRSRLEKVFYFPYIPPRRIWQKNLRLQRQEVAIVGTYSQSIGEYRGNSNFFNAVEKIIRELKKRNLLFVTVGNGNQIVTYTSIKNYGFISDSKFIKIQSKICGIIIPTDWGWGFKTKVADALFAGQRVYLPLSLSERYPSWSRALNPIRDWSDFTWRKFSKEESRNRAELKNLQLRIRRDVARNIL